MESFVTGSTIKKLREKKNITQAALAGKIGVSDKTISKWESGRGLPDISLLEPLSLALDISVAELFAGEQIVNQNKAANMKKMCFYVCPVCGNVIFSAGDAFITCCGIRLPVQEAEVADEMDGNHAINIERIDDRYYVSIPHDMEKSHYISFIAYVTSDGCQMKKLYPQQNAEGYFRIAGHGRIYAYCNRHGLFMKNV